MTPRFGQQGAALSSLTLGIGAAIVAAALIAGSLAVFWPGQRMVRATAYFDQAVGLYEGSDVSVLGVKIGEITEVTPVGDRVRVRMAYSAEHRVPANAKAAIVAPSVVSDRYVQLAPAYTGGAVMRDGATIPLSRTAVPVELDQTYEALNQLNVALGPKGANRHGSLSRLLKVSAENLRGQGGSIHQTVDELSKASKTLAGGRKDLFGTVRNLQQFTTALARNDAQVEAFNQDLAEVSRQLDGEGEELSAALHHLSIALNDVAGFVRQNKGQLSENVDELAQVTRVLAQEKQTLAEIIDAAPGALSNLQLAYQPSSGTLNTRTNLEQIDDPDMYVCSLLYSLDVPPKQCEPLLAPLGALNGAQGDLPHADDLGGLLGKSNTAPEPGGPSPGPSPSPDQSGEPDSTLGGLLGGGDS